MKHISLFSGIGGFDLAAEWMGWENVAHCEWNSFGQRVLKYYWPNAISYHDITKTDFTIHRGTIDIVTGGFPCQPYSVAGKRKGKEDERHLWPEMLRAIREIQPRWVVGENVRGIINWNGGLVFNEVQADLEAEGYETLPFLLPASGVNAPHERYRTWFIAYAHNKGRSSGLGEVPKENGEISEWYQNAKPCDTGVARFTANTNNEGRQTGAGNCEWKGCQQVKEIRNEVRSDIRPADESRDAADAQGVGSTGELLNRQKEGQFRRCNCISHGVGNNAMCSRQSCQKYRKDESGRFAEKSLPNDWENFPTQFPICTGDDGFPTELVRQRIREDSMGYLSEKEIDKIISKARTTWRNESIKAGGNAIVPQVALQIFKSIDMYEKSVNL